MNLALIEELKTLNGIQVVAVSKKRTKEQVNEMAEHGITTFGENRVQEFLTKYDPKYKWHIIGHLQTNKVKYIIGKVDVIESLDSIKLAKEIEKYAHKENLIQDVLIQIKISDDPNKTGLSYKEALPFLEEVMKMEHIRIRGWMCVATHTEEQDLIEQEFEQMHQLYLQSKEICSSIDTLSMGMSHDYPLALKHGSNTIRIGTALFEG